MRSPAGVKPISRAAPRFRLPVASPPVHWRGTSRSIPRTPWRRCGGRGGHQRDMCYTAAQLSNTAVLSNAVADTCKSARCRYTTRCTTMTRGCFGHGIATDCQRFTGRVPHTRWRGQSRDGVTFSLERGKVLALLGESGSGEERHHALAGPALAHGQDALAGEITIKVQSLYALSEGECKHPCGVFACSGAQPTVAWMFPILS